MYISMDTAVECADGLCGRSTQIVVDLNTDRVTHLVIMDEPSRIQRLVPIAEVMDSASNRIRLRCTRTQLSGMMDFVKREYVRVKVPPAYWPGEYTMEPLWFSPTARVAIEHHLIPPGHIALHGGLRVKVLDGTMGPMDGVLLDSSDGHITHLVLHQGHLWNKRRLVVPFWLIEEIKEDAIHIRLSKRFLETLPTLGAFEDASKED